MQEGFRCGRGTNLLGLRSMVDDTAGGDPDIAGCRGVPDSESLNRSIVATSGLSVGAAQNDGERHAAGPRLPAAMHHYYCPQP